MLRNTDIRQAAAKKGVRQWEIAEKMGKSEMTLCRILRKELSENEKMYILNMIESIAKEKIAI